MLNKETSIKRAIDTKVVSIKMPLYVKLLDFWNRHNHYKLLTNKIIKDKKSDSEKLIAIFNWTSKSIRATPKGFPVVDDHVDNIIIRGYGVSDQSADVFTTLAVFSGYNAGMYLVKIYPEKKVHTLSIVEVNKRFLVFDTFNKVYFHNDNGDIASIREIKKNLDIVKRAVNKSDVINKDRYIRYFKNLKTVESLGYSKADLQMVSKRIIYSLLRLLKIIKPSRAFYGDNFG